MDKIDHSAQEALLLKLMYEARLATRPKVKQSNVESHIDGAYPTWMSSIERGRRRMSVKEFFEIAEVVGFDPHELLKKVWR